MPVVKLSWTKTPEALEKYLTKDRDADTVETSSHGLEEGMAQSVRDEHESFKDSSKNMALQIIQSWPAKESDLYKPDKYNEMGQELAKRVAPGHLFWVYTHTENKCIHNHIVISAVHSETGKRIENKKALIFNTRDHNDAIARENGFSVLAPSIKSREEKLPEKVKSMLAHGKKSWRYDLLRKADFARSASTSFDDYVSLLGPLGVNVRVENKNISYLYGDRTKAIRGKNVGEKFTKDGLIKAFKENDERFAKDSGLRARILGEFRNSFDEKGNSLGVASNLLSESAGHTGLGKKDYGQFTKLDRRRNNNVLPRAFTEPNGILASEMKKTLDVSLFDYCKEHKIALTTNQKGQTVLRGREHIIVNEFSYKNAKGGGGGKLIDFVAYHDGIDFLHAIAKIRNNPRLLLLSDVMGEQTQTYRAFYAPKPEPGITEAAKKTLSAFVHSKGFYGRDVETLLQSRNVYAGKNNSLWLLGDKKESALEFREEPKGKWTQKRHGKSNSAFFEQIGKSKQMVVFRDPFEFILAKNKGTLARHGNASFFVMLDEGSKTRLDEIMAFNTHITEIHLATSSIAKNQEKERSFSHEMRAKFNPFDIHVKELSHSGLGKEKARGPDISI